MPSLGPRTGRLQQLTHPPAGGLPQAVRPKHAEHHHSSALAWERTDCTDNTSLPLMGFHGAPEQTRHVNKVISIWIGAIGSHFWGPEVHCPQNPHQKCARAPGLPGSPSRQHVDVAQAAYSPCVVMSVVGQGPWGSILHDHFLHRNGRPDTLPRKHRRQSCSRASGLDARALLRGHSPGTEGCDAQRLHTAHRRGRHRRRGISVPPVKVPSAMRDTVPDSPGTFCWRDRDRDGAR